MNMIPKIKYNERTNIFLLLGYSKAGKDEIGKILAESYGFYVDAFANEVKRRYAIQNNIMESTLHIQSPEKERHRDGLIEFGENEKKNKGETIWIDRTMDKYKDDEGVFLPNRNILITDCRRPSEINWVQRQKQLQDEELYGKDFVRKYHVKYWLIYVDRQEYKKKDNDSLTDIAVNIALSRDIVDDTIDNNKDLDNLNSETQRVFTKYFNGDMSSRGLRVINFQI